ncbi:MAG: flagellin [Peptococcaceae bacterium]|jgi:flagellin|nr:flagellin [Peptococcaceae bacterium]
MRINQNIAALNAWRGLTQTDTALSKSLEKLSSGMRINRAGDDAAGLAISEKMRGQIRGLNQAMRNAQDGISLIQTAEGALSETHSILQRMRELAVQAANDTATSADRAEIQKEVDELAKEITRISNTSEFNTKNLLAGGFSSSFHIGANAAQSISLSVSAMDAYTLGVAGNLVTTSYTGTNTGVSSISTASENLNGLFLSVTKTNQTLSAVTPSNAAGGAGTLNAASNYSAATDKSFIVKIGTVDGSGKVTAASYSTDGGGTWSSAVVDSSGANGIVTLSDGLQLTIATDADNASGDTYSFSATAQYLSFQVNTAADGTGTRYGDIVKAYNNQSSVVVGDADHQLTASFTFSTVVSKVAEGSYSGDQITQTITSSSAAVTAADGSVTTAAVAQKGINVSTQDDANNAITKINTAISTVSAERSKLGAYQNRLEHTIANLGTASENLSAAESRIRDADMASEIMNFTKLNILAQAGTAMLAQANMRPQSVLQLLQ